MLCTDVCIVLRYSRYAMYGVVLVTTFRAREPTRKVHSLPLSDTSLWCACGDKGRANVSFQGLLK